MTHTNVTYSLLHRCTILYRHDKMYPHRRWKWKIPSYRLIQIQCFMYIRWMYELPAMVNGMCIQKGRYVGAHIVDVCLCSIQCKQTHRHTFIIVLAEVLFAKHKRGTTWVSVLWVEYYNEGKRHAGMIIKHFHSIWIENRYVCPADTTPLPPPAHLRNTHI